VKENLNAGEAARDVATAELFLKNHQDLCDDIRAHQDECVNPLFVICNLCELTGECFWLLSSFDSLAGLASKLPNNKEVREKAQQLDEERRALQRGWQQKDDFLRQTFDLQIFNKEADQIDAASSSHEAFLEFFDLGVRIETFSRCCFYSVERSFDERPFFIGSRRWMTWKLFRSGTRTLRTRWPPRMNDSKCLAKRPTSSSLPNITIVKSMIFRFIRGGTEFTHIEI